MKNLRYIGPDDGEHVLECDKSLAFMPDVVEEWNRRAEAIHPTLYCFAHYEPRVWVSEDAEAGFLRAVANVYGLLVDCGNLIKAIALKEMLKVYLLEEELTRLKSFYKTVCSLRTVLFHNSSGGLNPANEAHKNVFTNYVGRSTGGVSVWECALVRLLNDTTQFERIMDSFITKIEQLSAKSREAVASVWRDKIILYWYKTNSDLFFGQATKAYTYWVKSCYTDQELAGRLLEDHLFRNTSQWVWRYVQYRKGTCADWSKVMNYTQKTLFAAEMERILKTSRAPALPSDFFQELFEEARSLGNILK